MGHRGEAHNVGGRALRTRRASRAIASAALVLAGVLVAAVLTAYGAYRDVFSKIQHVNVTGLGKRPPSYDNSLNILVIGSDTRKGRNSRFGAHIPGQRSDTIMVLHLSPGHRRAIVLSIPRDSVVPVLQCPPAAGAPGQTAQPGQVEQINATFAFGGPGCLWKTIEHTTGVRLDHFIELNFTGFERVINDVGGVSVCLPYAIDDPRSRLRLSAGLHHVSGSQALAYWRVRYIGMGSDLERILRDQYLLAAIAQDVKHTNLLHDPGQVMKLVTDITSSLTTDSGLTQAMMISLAQRIRSMPLGDVHFVELPVLPYPQDPAWVEWPSQAHTLFSLIAHDRRLPRARPHRHRHRRAGTQTVGGSSMLVPSGARSRSPSPASTASRAPAVGKMTRASPGLPKSAGGITANVNVCKDSSAFAGPLGGH